MHVTFSLASLLPTFCRPLTRGLLHLVARRLLKTPLIVRPSGDSDERFPQLGTRGE